MAATRSRPDQGYIDQDSDAGQDSDEQPLGQLFSELADNLQQLMRKEVELAKVEATEQAKRASKAGAMFGAGVTLGIFGLLLLLFAAAWGLATVMNTGLAFLIVSILCLVVAGLCAVLGRKRLAQIRPPQETVQTIKQDVQVAQSALKRGLSAEPAPTSKGR